MSLVGQAEPYHEHDPDLGFECDCPSYREGGMTNVNVIWSDEIVVLVGLSPLEDVLRVGLRN